jgi:hypothetical protein
MVRGETQMRRIAGRVVSVTLCALLLLAVSAAPALAQSGQAAAFPAAGRQANLLPEDPGLE